MSLSDSSNQAQAIGVLQRSLAQGRVGHAYLFVGGDLTQLEQIGRNFAKALNCEQPVSAGEGVDSCDVCSSCRKIDQDNHADVQWVRPESKLRVITIDQMRAVMQSVNLKGLHSGHKIYLISAADRLNVQAANAFLKTLEEPPPRSVVVMLSTEPTRMLETILSRCLRLTFGAGEGREFKTAHTDWLKSFLPLVGDAQQGLLGRYRLLGHLLNALEQRKGTIEKELEARSPLSRHDDIDPRLKDQWESELTAAIEAEYRHDRSELLLLLEYWFRDVWLAAEQGGEGLLHFPDFKPTTDKVAGRIGAQKARENLSILERVQRLLQTNVQEALTLEVGFLKLAV